MWSASTAHNVGATALCTGVFLPVVCLHCPQCGCHRTVYRCFLTCGLPPLPTMWAPRHCVQVFSYLWSTSTAHNVGATALCTGVFLPVVSLHCPQCGRHRAVYRCFLTCGIATSSASSFIRWHSHLTITSARSTANLRCSTVACHSHMSPRVLATINYVTQHKENNISPCGLS